MTHSREAREALQLLSQTLQAVETDSPMSQVTSVRPYLRYVAGMYQRCRGYAEGVYATLERGLQASALTLARSLFEDSLRLGIMANARDEARRNLIVANWMIMSREREKGLFSRAKTLEVGWDHDMLLDSIEKELQQWRQWREKKGGKAHDPFNDNALERFALRQGRKGAWWLRSMADHFVHGNALSHRLMIGVLDDGADAHYLRSFEPRATVDTAAFALESLVEGHKAACTMLDRPSDTGLADLLTAIERLQEQVAPQP